MSATLTPIETVESPRPQVVARPAPAPVWHDTRPTRSTGRLGNALFFATWAPALAAASAVAAVALAVSTPVWMVRVVHGERRYR
jgi:hypothetical protein